jgi:hypothetical protein
LFEFATTLALGNVLSFRLGHLRLKPSQSYSVHASATDATNDVEMVWAKPHKFKKQLAHLDVQNAKCRVNSDWQVIRSRVVELGGGDPKKGFQQINGTVKHALDVLQELLEWKDNEVSYAAFNGEVSRLEKLLRSGENPNQADKT